MTEYISTSTGNKLIRKPNMFAWRGQSFHGLVDVEKNALYDDPEDSFAAVLGIDSSLHQGLIQVSNITGEALPNYKGETKL